MAEDRLPLDDETYRRLARAGYLVCILEYGARLAADAQATLLWLMEFPRDEIVEHNGWFHLAKEVSPRAGGGFHPRLTMGFFRRVKGAVEIFSPRKVAAGEQRGFVRADLTSLLGSAAQGELLFLRAARRETLEQVQDFFSHSPLFTERSKGDG